MNLTAAFNEQFRRNRDRFPKDFAFQLSTEEFDSLRSQIVTFGGLNSPRAVETSANTAIGYE
jgi:hypothetical protein